MAGIVDYLGADPKCRTLEHWSPQQDILFNSIKFQSNILKILCVKTTFSLISEFDIDLIFNN